MSEEKVEPQKIDSLIGSIQTLVEGYVSQARLFDTLDLELSAIEIEQQAAAQSQKELLMIGLGGLAALALAIVPIVFITSRTAR